MDEIKQIVFIGFSLNYATYYSDSLTISKDGDIEYHGTIHGRDYKWEFHTTSDGYQLLFSSIIIELFNSNFEQVVKDDSACGYKIEVITIDDEKFLYTFYGLMEQNNHSGLRNELLELIPIFEELPLYMESIQEELLVNDENMMES